MIRVAILSNQDPVSNMLFTALWDIPEVEVCGIGFTTTLTKKERFSAGLWDIYKKTGFRYFFFQVAWNLIYRLRSLKILPGTRGCFSMKAKAMKDGVPVEHSSNFNSQEFLRTLRGWTPDLIITRANQIFKKELLASARYGVWCCHSSLLPAYRGIAAEFHVLNNGEKCTGFTVYQINELLDKGDVIDQVETPVVKNDTVYRLTLRNVASGRASIVRSIQKLLAGEIDALTQRGKGCYYSWPSSDVVKAFKDKGKRFVDFHDIIRMCF